MTVLLSSDAMPHAGIDRLIHACDRRALAGLELSIGTGHRHGADASLCPIRQQEGEGCVPGGVASRIFWLRVPAGESLHMLMILAAEAHRLGAGVLLSAPVPELPLATRVALIHGAGVEEARQAADWARRTGSHTCLETGSNPADAAHLDAVLDATWPMLAHVRLLGSGPEALEDDDSVAGTLLTRLALRGFTGSISLAPSSPARTRQWERWLLNERGWGCGTAAEKKARAEQRKSIPAS